MSLDGAETKAYSRYEIPTYRTAVGILYSDSTGIFTHSLGPIGIRPESPSGSRSCSPFTHTHAQLIAESLDLLGMCKKYKYLSSWLALFSLNIT